MKSKEHFSIDFHDNFIVLEKQTSQLIGFPFTQQNITILDMCVLYVFFFIASDYNLIFIDFITS